MSVLVLHWAAISVLGMEYGRWPTVIMRTGAKLLEHQAVDLSEKRGRIRSYEQVGVIMNVYSRKLRCCNTKMSTSIAEHYFVVGISISKSKCFPQSWQEGGEGLRYDRLKELTHSIDHTGH